MEGWRCHVGVKVVHRRRLRWDIPILEGGSCRVGSCLYPSEVRFERGNPFQARFDDVFPWKSFFFSSKEEDGIKLGGG